MIGFSGFNVGVNISLGDMETALDYINNGSVYKDDIEKLRLQRKSVGITTIIESNKLINEEETVLSTGITDESYDTSLDYEDNDYEDNDYEDNKFFDDEAIEDEELDDEFEGGELEDDDFDSYFDDEDEYEDDEDEYEVAKYVENVYNNAVKSAREIELERQLEELKRAEEERLRRQREEEAKLEQLRLQEERERQLEEQIKAVQMNREAAKINANKTIENGGGTSVKESAKGNVQRGAGGRSRVDSAIINASNSEASTRGKSAKHGERLVGNSSGGIDYSSLEIEALWTEVRKFMLSNGVQSKLISKKLVEDKFGASNIKKLYLKGYLIPFGSKLTIGK